MGNAAIALAALKAGVNVACGYPGTPSSEIIETLSARNPGGVYVEWSDNEKVALELAAGASFSGARSIVTMKLVGLNVAADALMSLPYLGVTGGLVLVVADDPGPISSQTEQDTRQFAAFAKVPCLDPATPEEAYQMTLAAFELSERHGTPVLVRPTTRICHSSIALDPAFDYQPHPVAGFERGSRWVVFPRRAYQGHLEILERLPQVMSEFAASPFNAILNRPATGGAAAPAATPVGIAAGGISWAYLLDALALQDAEQQAALPELRLLKVGTPFPFPDQLAADFLTGLGEVLVFEELEPWIENELTRVAGACHLPAIIQGKLTGHTTLAGENTVTAIRDQLLGFFSSSQPAAASTPAAATSAQPTVNLPARPPILCAGCPHRASYYAIKRAMRGKPGVYCADIGCYTLGNAMPLDMVDTCVCMGAGFTVPQGMARVQPDKVHFGLMGDSTFFASGLTGAANAVYNQTRVILCVLDNRITAMTGAQPHPGTGIRMSSDATPADAANALDAAAILRAMGVRQVQEVNPFELQATIEAIREAVRFVSEGEPQGPSAIVFKAPCITVSKPQPAPEVDQGKCTRCKLCIKAIGCPAIVVHKGDVVIDQQQCYGCHLCEQICPQNAIGVPS
ncbi:MAG: 4Fe-4S binding protein [Coriobacteriales bacterium]|jgi:indolepyruvate ferredoxin oxidoreductase alpha subunit|nr:4Fe-4S binding protein [Coriobacteriales bacterium]